MAETEAPEPAIYCVDTGHGSRTGWARRRHGQWTTGHELTSLAEKLRTDLSVGLPIALGMEAPLWVPIAEEPNHLTAARPNETIPWSSQVGATVAILNVAGLSWLLRACRDALEGYQVRTANALHLRERVLFLWEAMISGRADSAADLVVALPDGWSYEARSDCCQLHIADAVVGVEEFHDRLENARVADEDVASDIARPQEGRFFSLAGAVLAEHGVAVSRDDGPPIVVRTQKPALLSIGELLRRVDVEPPEPGEMFRLKTPKETTVSAESFKTLRELVEGTADPAAHWDALAKNVGSKSGKLLKRQVERGRGLLASRRLVGWAVAARRLERPIEEVLTLAPRPGKNRK